MLHLQKRTEVYLVMSASLPQSASSRDGLSSQRSPEELAREREALYAVFVQTITATESRRQQLSLGFAAMGAALATAATAFAEVEPILVSVIVLIIAYVWWRSLHHYKRLARSKFHVVALFEAHFATQPFSEEWRHFKGDAESHGPDEPKRLRLSDIEMLVPRLMIAGSVLYLGWEAAQALRPHFGI